jgi:hypothetical protein
MKKIARQEKNLPEEKSVGPKFPHMLSENAKPLEITSFYRCHFYLELCKLHQMQIYALTISHIGTASEHS